MSILRLSGHTRIWIVGSSLIKHAYRHTSSSVHVGPDLDLQRCDASIRWQAKGGLRSEGLKKFVRDTLVIEDPPQFMVIHCGANNVGQDKSHDLISDMKSIIDHFFTSLPLTKIVWSQMLPRLKFRFGKNQKALEQVLVNVNSKMASYVLDNGGYYIKYPEISHRDPGLFSDGVHLSDIGKDIMLHRLQQGLYTFMTSQARVYPQHGEIGPWLRESFY